MIEKYHGYRFVAEISKPYELYEMLKSNLVKDFKLIDSGKNCVFKTNNFTLVLSLKYGKLTIYTDKNKQEFLKEIKTLVEENIFKEFFHSIRLIRKEVRKYRPYLTTKNGYCDYHTYFNKRSGYPLPLLNLQKQINLDILDIRILKYIYENFGVDVKTCCKIFKLKYHKCKRKLDKLVQLSFIEKIGKSPALYDIISNQDRKILISQLISFWLKLFPMANLQEVQITRAYTFKEIVKYGGVF